MTVLEQATYVYIHKSIVNIFVFDKEQIGRIYPFMINQHWARPTNFLLELSA